MKSLAIAFAVMLAVASSAAAQTSVTSAPASFTAGPWQQNAVAGIQMKSAAVDYSSSAALASTGMNKGQPIALMAVGGAAIVLGALMDNDARGFLMVGGSIIGLYGLYLYLR